MTDLISFITNQQMSDSRKPRIINIMPSVPAYHFASPSERPDVWWKKADGDWLGFWTREWPDLLGEAVLKQTDQYAMEVWQPDHRAERIYTKILDTGVTHRLFPANWKIYRPGIRQQNGYYSESIISQLRKIQDTPIVLTLFSTYGFRIPFFIEILKIFGPSRKFPIFFRGGGQFKAPLSEMFSLNRPLTYLCLIVEHLRLKKLIKHVDLISEQSELALREVGKIYNGRVERLTRGCYFEFWVPVPSQEKRERVRKKLNVPDYKTVFLATGYFSPVKQLDKLIKVFQKLSERSDFLLIIVGRGTEYYTNFLRSLAKELVKHNKAVFHPFLTGEELRDIYWASDVYISVSTDEGGPTSVMKAMACGLPIISTPVGETSDRMKKCGVGRFVPVRDYSEWATAFLEILEKKIPEVIDIEIARCAYDWPNVAKQFINVYHDLCKMYFEI